MKVQVQNLSKAYKNKTVLDNVSFSVGDNEIMAIVGPNGAGKTTLLETMMTLRKHDEGSITLMNYAMETKNLKKIRGKMGVIFQEGGMYAYLKIKEILDLFTSFYGVQPERTEEIIELFNLSSHLSVKFESLSGGWKQRVLLAIAFLHRPELLFLDEPTTGLDPEASENLWEAIKIAKGEGATIILSTHSLEEIDMYADRVLILNEGKIASYEKPEQIKKNFNAAFFKDAYFQLLKYRGGAS